MNDPTTGDEADGVVGDSTLGGTNGEVPSSNDTPSSGRAARRRRSGRSSAAGRPDDADADPDAGALEDVPPAADLTMSDELDDDDITDETPLADDGDGKPDGVAHVDAMVAGDDVPDDAGEWSGLRPLADDDLAALDPAALEDDLVDEDEITDVAEPPAPAGPASTRTADDLTSATVLRSSSRPPQSGWRRLIHRLTGGAVSPNASRGERARAEQLGAIRTLVAHPRRITVLSRKGGVGKTTTALMLGQTLASERGDRIVAVDGNPDAGNLGYRIDPKGPEASITDLLNELENIHRYADMRRFTTQTSVGLEVLRSDDDPQISTALGDQEYGAIMSLLDRFYNLILIDTGTGILDSAVQGILDGTDQIVLVVAPSLDAARSASQTLDWLTEHGFVGLVENAVAVINQTRRSSMVDVARIEDHFWDRCGATVRIPWDNFLEAGAETELVDLRPATREAYRHLAAAVARRFDT
jgi:MinD-like ATPase involved in chromosome partitioning or flagellar assembly